VPELVAAGLPGDVETDAIAVAEGVAGEAPEVGTLGVVPPLGPAQDASSIAATNTGMTRRIAACSRRSVTGA
jgi:hypothetical protein